MMTLRVSKIGMISTHTAAEMEPLNFAVCPKGSAALALMKRIAKKERINPMVSAPVSPINILDGCQLKIRKAIIAPAKHKAIRLRNPRSAK